MRRANSGKCNNKSAKVALSEVQKRGDSRCMLLREKHYIGGSDFYFMTRKSSMCEVARDMKE